MFVQKTGSRSRERTSIYHAWKHTRGNPSTATGGHANSQRTSCAHVPGPLLYVCIIMCYIYVWKNFSSAFDSFQSSAFPHTYMYISVCIYVCIYMYMHFSNARLAHISQVLFPFSSSHLPPLLLLPPLLKSMPLSCSLSFNWFAFSRSLSLARPLSAFCLSLCVLFISLRFV